MYISHLPMLDFVVMAHLETTEGTRGPSPSYRVSGRKHRRGRHVEVRFGADPGH